MYTGTLINDLMKTVARAEDNRMELNRTPTSLTDIIMPLVQKRQIAAKYHHVTLAAQLDAEEIVPIDSDVVVRVIENVLDNALRYTPRGGVISLIARVVGSQLQLRIGNSGEAIPAKDRETLFDKYAQATVARITSFHCVEASA